VAVFERICQRENFASSKMNTTQVSFSTIRSVYDNRFGAVLNATEYHLHSFWLAILLYLRLP